MADPVAPWVTTPTQHNSWLARKWKLLVGLLVGLPVLLIAAAVGLIAIFVLSRRGSDVAREALAKARSNAAVARYLGTPIKEGWLVNGSSGSDDDLRVPISGPKGSGTVHVIAQNSDGRWTYSLMQAEIDGREEKIDLLAGSSLPQGDATETVAFNPAAKSGRVSSAPPAQTRVPKATSVQTFSVGKGPRDMVFDGANIWVANILGDSVTKLSASNGAVVGTYPVATHPRYLAFDGTNIWISNDNRVTKLLASNGEGVGSYDVGSRPRGLAFDGTNIWVVGSNNSVNKLSAGGEVVASCTVGSDPSAVAFDGSNIWVVNHGSNTVTKLLASSGVVLGTYGVGSGPDGLAFDGKNIWVANALSDNLTKLLASSGTEVGTYDAGKGHPWGLASDGKNVWVANYQGNAVSTVTQLSALTGDIVTTYPAGRGPGFVTVDGSNIWVSNLLSDNVTEIPQPGHIYTFPNLNLTWLVILFLVVMAYRNRHKFRSPERTTGGTVRTPLGNDPTYATGMPNVSAPTPVAYPSGMQTVIPPPPVLGAGGIFGLVFQSLVGSVFAGVGLFMLARSLGLTPSRTNDPTELYVGIFSSLLGLGVVFWGLRVAIRALTLKMRRAKYPTEPWLWRKDWAQGRAYTKIGTKLFVAWGLAGFFNLTLPLIFHFLVNLPQEVHKSGAGAYMILLFPIFGAIALIYAVRETIRYFEFGRTYFEMPTVPSVIGGELKGFIQARFPHSPDHGIHLQLSCVDHYEGGRSTHSSLLWRDEADLSPMQLSAGPRGPTIPVAFRIPPDARPTAQLSTASEIVWRLEALADVPGVNYHDIFEVPVFRTQQSLAQMQTEPSVPFEDSAAVAVEQPSPVISSTRSWKEALRDVSDAGHIGELPGTFGPPETGQSIAPPSSLSFKVRGTANGTEFYFPASRNRRSATILTAVLLGLYACMFILITTHAAMFLQVFVACFSLLWTYGAIQTWMGNTRVIIGNGSLTLRSSLLGSGKVRQIPLSEIVSIRAGIGGTDQAGETLTPIYFVEVAQKNGKKLGLTQSRDKHEVEWLLQEMSRLAGLSPRR
jgi:Cytochrome oxidase complex assembly protein 1